MNRKKTITELKKIFAEKDTSECKNIPESEQEGYFEHTYTDEVEDEN